MPFESWLALWLVAETAVGVVGCLRKPTPAEPFARRCPLKGTSPTPPSSPVVHESIAVPSAIGTNPSIRTISKTLTTPITLTAGEELFVGVEMVSSGSLTNCVALCTGTGTPNRNWWSNSATAPYSWQTIASFGINNNAAIEATVQ